MISFDQILQTKIKFGRYQKQSVLILGLIDFVDGMEQIYISLLLPLLQADWNLAPTQLTLLGSFFFVGHFIGTILSAFFTDIVGRRLTIVIISVLQIMTTLASAVCQNFIQMFLLRTFMGILIGIMLPISYLIVSEIVTPEKRGSISMVLMVLQTTGKCYMVLLSLIFLDGYTSGNWRAIFICNSIPMIVCLVFSIVLLRESSRFALMKGQYFQAFSNIDQTIQTNNPSDAVLLEQEEKDGLIQWQIQNSRDALAQKSFKELFKQKYLSTTMRVWILFYGAQFINTMILLLMPFLFDNSGNGLISIIYVFIGELLIAFCIYMVIDDPWLGQRRYLLIVLTLCTLSAQIFILFNKENYIVIAIVLAKLSVRGIITVTRIVTCESYGTVYRTMGLAFGYGSGNFANSTVPYIIFPLYFINPFYPFYAGAILNLIVMVTILTFPYDSGNKSLEQLDNEIKID